MSNYPISSCWVRKSREGGQNNILIYEKYEAYYWEGSSIGSTVQVEHRSFLTEVGRPSCQQLCNEREASRGDLHGVRQCNRHCPAPPHLQPSHLEQGHPSCVVAVGIFPSLECKLWSVASVSVGPGQAAAPDPDSLGGTPIGIRVGTRLGEAIPLFLSRTALRHCSAAPAVASPRW